MDIKLFLFVSKATITQLKQGRKVEVATRASYATIAKQALVKEEPNDNEMPDSMLVNVKFSHSQFGLHFIFLSPEKESPIQVSLAIDVKQRGVGCK